MTVKALIYVQHLLGIGHLARMHRIASAMISAGLNTTLVQGGTESGLAQAVGAKLIKLTPVKVTASDMTTLLHEDGRLFSQADKNTRCNHLLQILREVQPDILIVEAFPFGRRQMRFELLPLLDEAKRLKVPVVACSIRDLLQENHKPGRAEETLSTVQRYFDTVLVHGDSQLTPLKRTFPLADQMATKTRYTGIIGPAPIVRKPGKHSIVVSAGGGAVGANLLEAAIRAAPQTQFKNEPWLVLAGPNLPESDYERLRSLAATTPGFIEVMRSVPNLPAVLAGAHLSISQAGYNTVADILVAGCSAVLSPFSAGGETEQTMRAEALAASGRVVLIRDHELEPQCMTEAIHKAALLAPASSIMLNGGASTARILLEALRAKTLFENTLKFKNSMSASFVGEQK